jgi:fermentation-respiration switch protein FrsA (DUF1100 family)
LACVCYLGVVIVFMSLENRFVYHPIRAAQDWQPPPDPRIQDVELHTADGTRIHAWWYPYPEAQGAVLYCHGNAGNLSHRGGSVVGLAKSLRASVLIFDYPGYGRSEGSPSESGCYAAADAAYDWLVQSQKIAPEKILLYGGSLGGGVAVELASRRPYRALFLVKTFTSLPDVGKSIVPWLPVRWLMRNRFDNLAKIGKCKQPVFIAHGTADRLVPFVLSERLFAAANEPKYFYRIDDADHNDPIPGEMIVALKQFLEKAESPSRN